MADKFVRVIVQENAKGAPELNKQGVPRTVDFAKTPEDRQVMELVYSQAVIGRPYRAAGRRAAPSAWRRCAKRSWRRSRTRRCWPKPKR